MSQNPAPHLEFSSPTGKVAMNTNIDSCQVHRFIIPNDPNCNARDMRHGRFISHHITLEVAKMKSLRAIPALPNRSATPWPADAGTFLEAYEIFTNHF